MELWVKHARAWTCTSVFRICIGRQLKRSLQAWLYRGLCRDGQPFTHIQDGVESCWGNIRADGGEDRPADLSDVSAWLGQQRQQDVHHHLHPLRLLLLLGHGCRGICIYLLVNQMSGSEVYVFMPVFWCLNLFMVFSNVKVSGRNFKGTYFAFVMNSNSLCFFFFLAFFSWALSTQLCRSFMISRSSSGAFGRNQLFFLLSAGDVYKDWTLPASVPWKDASQVTERVAGRQRSLRLMPSWLFSSGLQPTPACCKTTNLPFRSNLTAEWISARLHKLNVAQKSWNNVDFSLKLHELNIRSSVLNETSCLTGCPTCPRPAAARGWRAGWTQHASVAEAGPERIGPGGRSTWSRRLSPPAFAYWLQMHLHPSPRPEACGAWTTGVCDGDRDMSSGRERRGETIFRQKNNKTLNVSKGKFTS